jgi:ketosteroid isomerase-like protein
MNYDQARYELVDLVKAWEQAIVADDPEAIGRFMAGDWVLVTPESGVVDRSRFLDAVASGALTLEAMESDVIRVRAYDDTVVLTARGTNNGAFQGQPFRSDEWITDVFVKQADGWRCVLTHLSPAASSAG